MRAPRIACLHPVLASLSFLAIALLLWPGLVHASRPMISPAPTPAATTSAAPEAWNKVRSARVKPGELLRVAGNFGEFSGRAAGIDELGLSGLQPDPAFDSSLPLPSEPLSWDEIHRVERRGTSSRRFARYGGVGLGLVYGLVLASSARSDFSEPGAYFVGGAVLGGAVGAAVGATIGAAVPRWNLVYRRRDGGR